MSTPWIQRLLNAASGGPDGIFTAESFPQVPFDGTVKVERVGSSQDRFLIGSKGKNPSDGSKAFVQGITLGSGGGTSISITLPNPTTEGNVLVVEAYFTCLRAPTPVQASSSLDTLFTPFWAALTTYGGGDTVFAPNSGIEVTFDSLINPMLPGVSGSSCPASFNPTVGGFTNDGNVKWRTIAAAPAVWPFLNPVGTGCFSYFDSATIGPSEPTTVTLTYQGDPGFGWVDIVIALSEYKADCEPRPAAIDFKLSSDSDPAQVVFSGLNAFGTYLHTTVLTHAYFPFTVDDLIADPDLITEAWLVIDEPSIGFTDRTLYMYKGEGNQNGWNSQQAQRGQATVHMIVPGGDPYAPTQFTPVFKFEQTVDGLFLVWSGLIQDVEVQYFGNLGDRFYTVTCVSWESIFDTVTVDTPKHYENETCGFIVADLFNSFEIGAFVTLGIISAGVVIPEFNARKGDKLADLFTQLATTSTFTWYVDLAAIQLNFCDPSAVPAPFTLVGSDILWDGVNWTIKGADFRTLQGVRLSFDAFEHSKEFFVGAGQTQITLSRPVQQVTNAYATLSTCNTVDGSLSGQPSPGDTFTIGPADGAWQAGHVYALNGVIIVNGFVQKVTTAGTSGGSMPSFSQITGQTTTDNTVIWTCIGPSGLATGTETYEWVAALDNTEFGQVLIGATAADSAQNQVDAINRYIDGAAGRGPGINYSLPTWENSQCNAIDLVGTGFTLQQKSAGTGWVAQVSATGSAFSWSAAFTSGGTSPQGSLGPNEGATIELQVYAQGSSTAAPGVSFIEGSNVVNLATPLNAGSNLNIEYTRADGDVIEVEDSALVATLAALTHGTGKYDAFTDIANTGLISTSRLAGLQFAQQALATYKIPPQYFRFPTFKPGLAVGQQLSVALGSYPTDASTLLDGDWIVDGVEAELIPVPSTGPAPYLPGFGHWRYRVSLINSQQIGGFLTFWKGKGGGSSASSGLSATSGGSQSTAGTALTMGGVNAQTANYAAVAGDFGKIISMNSGSALTLTLPSSPPSAQWNIFVQCVGAGGVTISRNGLNIDGAASNVTLTQGEGCYISTDGTNYFTERGVGFQNPMTAKGDVIVGGTGGTPQRLAAGSNGMVLTANSAATNGEDFEAPIALTTTGTSGPSTLTPGNPYALNVPQYSGGGGGGPNKVVVFTSPVLGSMTWVNQGTATAATNPDNSVSILNPATADAVRGLSLTVPGATPYSIYGAFNFFATTGNAGLFVSDGTKIITFNKNTSQASGFKVQRWTNSGTFSIDSYSAAMLVYAQVIFLRIDNDGTNLNYYVSPDGFTWQLLFSEAKGAFLGTITTFGFYIDNATATTAGIVQCLSISTSAFTAA